jgi:hypothetical protein
LAQGLLGLQEPHVYILLMGCGDLLLLLLQQLNLLLNGQLFHYPQKHVSPSFSTPEMTITKRNALQRTHQRSELRRTSPMSYMKPAAGGARDPWLTLLVHVSELIK